MLMNASEGLGEAGAAVRVKQAVQGAEMSHHCTWGRDQTWDTMTHTEDEEGGRVRMRRRGRSLLSKCPIIPLHDSDGAQGVLSNYAVNCKAFVSAESVCFLQAG